MKIPDTIADFLFSPKSKCLGCGSYRGCDMGWLCSECYATLKPYYADGRSRLSICENCGEAVTDIACPRCGLSPAKTIPACSAHPYSPPASILLKKFKYSGLSKLADWMADEMVLALNDARFCDFTVVTHVPMHLLRYLFRSYNQAAVLARALAKKLDKPERSLLRRVKYTRHQTRLSAEKRRKNLNSAFSALKEFKGERVLLIDDVRTTGTTVLMCARELLKAGAESVCICTFASTEHRK